MEYHECVVQCKRLKRPCHKFLSKLAPSHYYSIEAIINFSCALRPICSKIIVNCRLTKQSSHDLTALSINLLVRIKLVSHVFPEAAFVKAPPRFQYVRVGQHGVPNVKMSLSHPHIQLNETTNFAGGKTEVE